jgi:hypothetical protein
MTRPAVGLLWAVAAAAAAAASQAQTVKLTQCVVDYGQLGIAP